MTDIAISVRNLSKKFRLFNSPKERLIEALHPLRKQYHREFWALRDVSFDIRRGEIFGILGQNGSGKSTLLQIICAVMQASGGEVQVNGRISALLELGAGFNPEFTGRDNVILNGAIMGLTRQEMLRKLPAIEAFADIGDFFDQPVKTYSSGMFVRVAFAAAINVDPEILVVDEALSVGDTKFQHRCFNRIREFMEQGKTIVVVSHSTDTLLRICHRGIVMHHGELRHIGPIKSAVNFYQNLLFGAFQKTEVLPQPDGRSELSGDPVEPLVVPWVMTSDTRDRVAEKKFYNDHEVRLGNEAVEIIDFDIVIDGEINPIEIASHKDGELIVKILFNESLAGVSVGFAIVSIDGIYVFGTNMAAMKQSLITAEAGACMAVRFAFKSHIVGGEFFLNLGCNQLIDGTDTFLDVRRSVAKLKFAATPEVAAGFVDLEVRHEVLNLQEPRQ